MDYIARIIADAFSRVCRERKKRKTVIRSGAMLPGKHRRFFEVILTRISVR